ncbi:MAG: glycoside hydrolase family 130 protein [Ginsengibacter sp.]
MKVTKNPIKLHATAKAVITQFLYLPGKDRIKNIVARLKKMDEKLVSEVLQKVIKNFGSRHRNLRETFLNHFTRINNQYPEDLRNFSEERKLLLGAFFTKEYSIQAAALFNPSIVPHPDQSSLSKSQQRFVMSLRATGEGHISSIVFMTGIVDDDARIQLDETSGYYTGLRKNEKSIYDKKFISDRAAVFPKFKMELLDILPDTFTAAEVMNTLNERSSKYFADDYSVNQMKEILDTNYELEESSHLPINEKVISPNAKAESMGMEDVRFVRFNDGEFVRYYGSYTAYNGKDIRTQLIETVDFNIFKIRTLYGAAVSDKGKALFPEKVNGKYVMIARQGGEKITIMFSDDLYFWDKFQVLMEARYPWELVQLGNCGSPIKTSRGWLLLTHGVGAMRTYVISAILLKLDDPSVIIARLSKPLIEADEMEREGYVPNVVYTCGLMRHGNLLVIPYAVSDSATGFVTVDLEDLLIEMTK